MKFDEPGNTLSPQDSARVLAYSSTIAGGFLFLYFLDHFIIGRFDPSYLFMWVIVLTSQHASSFTKYGPHVFWGLWCGIWMLSWIEVRRSRGSRRMAVISLAVLIGGIVLAMMINHMMRSIAFRGVGSFP